MARDPLVGFLEKRSRRRFAVLVKATRDDVLNAAYRVTGDKDLAEDVTQDVFVKLLTSKWNPERIRCGKGLLISTAVLTALMRVRSEDRLLHREQQAAESSSAPQSALSREQLLDIRDAILDLPQALQACVELRYYGGLSTREVAVALECSQGAVKARLAKARSILRDRLGPPAALFLFPLLAGEGKAATVAISPSSALRRELSRLVADGPVMTALAAGAVASGSTKALVLISTLLLIAGTGGWFLVPRNLPREGKPHATLERRTTLLLPSKTSGTPTVVERTLTIELHGDGLDWPPESIRVRLSGQGVDLSRLSEKGAPVSMDVPPGAYTLETDGRPNWSHESLNVVVDPVATDPQSVTVTLTDSFDLEGFALDSAGNGVDLCVVNVLGPDLEEICTVTTSDMQNTYRHPPLEPYEFRIHLPLGSIYELRARHSLNLYEPSVVQILNEDGAGRLRHDLILPPAGPPLRLQLRGCDGKPPADARGAQVSVDQGKNWHYGYGVLTKDKQDDGTLLLRTFPHDAPFPLFVSCRGYASTQMILDPSHLSDPLVIQLECTQVFYGRVVPSKPRQHNWSQYWNVSVDGPTLRGDTQAVDDEDGRFVVRASDMKVVSVSVVGFGYERLFVDLSQATSPEEPAILRPESYGDGDAHVRLSVASERSDLSGATATLEPSKQDLSNLYHSYSVPIFHQEAIYEGVLPGYYDVKVTSADGPELARQDKQLVRAPESTLHVTVDRTLCRIQIQNRRALGDLELRLHVDDEKDVDVPHGNDVTLEFAIRPGWHNVELSGPSGRLLYRGLLDLRAEPPAVFDLSKSLSMEVRRNGPSAPLFLRGTSGNLSDGFKSVSVSFPLNPEADVTRLLWILGPRTHISLEGEHGYFYVNPDEEHDLRISIGRRGELTIPLERRNDEGRCFLMGVVAGERAMYWALAPAPSGNSLIVPLETELSRWALLEYRARQLVDMIVDGQTLQHTIRGIRVIAADGAPAQGASVSIRGKSLLGLDLGSYFPWTSQDFFFTLGEGSTDADGQATLDAVALEDAEVVVRHHGLKRVCGLPKSVQTLSIELTEAVGTSSE